MKSLTLTRKYLFLFIGFLSLQVLQLGVGVYGMLHVGEEGAYINEAGKQRMRTLLLANYARGMLEPDTQDIDYRKLLALGMAEYDQGFAVMYVHSQKTRGGTTLLKQLSEARVAWSEEMYPLLKQIDPDDLIASKAALAHYDALSFLQVAKLYEVVRLVEEDLREDTRWLAIAQAVVVSLTILLGIIGALMERRTVIHPLQKLTEAAHAFATGAYSSRVVIGSRDEIGELGNMFNHMAASISEKTERLNMLNKTAVAVSSTLGLKETLEEIMRNGMQLAGASATCIAFYDADEKCFNEWVTRGLSDHFVRNISFSPGGLADRIITAPGRLGSHVLSNDRPQTKYKLSKLARAEGIKCFLCLPLISHIGPLGVIYLYRSDRDTFDIDEITSLVTFTHLVAEVIENARLHARVSDQAVTDVLTGLPNRRMLEQRLAEEYSRADRYGHYLSVMMLDIDHFKMVNDTHGHQAGDTALKTLAQIISRQIRDVDLVGRYGGEEFVFIFPEKDSVGADLAAERIRQAIATTPIMLSGGNEIHLTVSIGIASIPGDASTHDMLLVHADQALYAAKLAGRNRVMKYQEMLKAELERSPERIAELLKQDLANAEAIMTAVDVKSTSTRRHSLHVKTHALQLGRALQLSKSDLGTLELASLLHDVGIISVPDIILNKPEALTDGEWRIIRQHPVIAADILGRVPSLRDVIPIVEHHHERYDGTGYPDGLKGEDIPYLARILSVADAYSALISDRPHRGSHTPEQALVIIRENAGSQFDPRIAEVFAASVQTN